MIGAARSPETIGHAIVVNLLTHGFVGPVYPVNPHATAIHSIPAYPDIASVPQAVDLAVIKHAVVQVADECGRHGCGVCWSSRLDSARSAAKGLIGNGNCSM